MSRVHADLIMLFAAAVWGVAFLFQKSAMDHVGPLTFIAARGLLAALALVPLAIRERRGAAGPPHALVPFYVRRPDAEIERDRRHR